MHQKIIQKLSVFWILHGSYRYRNVARVKNKLEMYGLGRNQGIKPVTVMKTEELLEKVYKRTR